MRVMAFDIGDARVGIAVSDDAMRIASPLKVMSLPEILQGSPSFKNLLIDYEPELFVSGLPLTLQGEERRQALKIREQAEQIATRYDIPLIFTDERMSSLEAKRILKEQGFSEKAMRGRVDAIAASLFLQSWLDAKRAKDDQDGNNEQD